MDITGEITKEQMDYAIDATVSLVVEDLARELHHTPDRMLYEFIASRTGALLYDGESGLWGAGPAYIEDMYRGEIHPEVQERAKEAIQ